MFALHVDDLLFACTDIDELENMKMELCRKYKMKDLGESCLVPAVEVSCNQEMGMFTVCQSSYAQGIT